MVGDPTLRAALFLHSHPGWSPRDLETADPDLVETMRLIGNAEADVARSAAQAQNMRS